MKNVRKKTQNEVSDFHFCVCGSELPFEVGKKYNCGCGRKWQFKKDCQILLFDSKHNDVVKLEIGE